MAYLWRQIKLLLAMRNLEKVQKTINRYGKLDKANMAANDQICELAAYIRSEM